MAKTPYLSIIIPTPNEEKYLPNLLQCLKNQTFKDFEIIVADALSKDITREIAIKSGARIVDGGLPGLARNNGAAVAKGEILLFCDADVVFGKLFLQRSIAEFKKRKLSTSNSLLGYYPNEFLYLFIYLGWNVIQILYNIFDKPIDSTQCMFTTKQNFEILNGFIPDLSLAEDQDFIERTVKNGGSFGILKTWIGPSPRRFKKVGLFKVLRAYIAGKDAMRNSQSSAIQTTKDLSDSIGGYGNW